jgi:hypothetical protein
MNCKKTQWNIYLSKLPFSIRSPCELSSTPALLSLDDLLCLIWLAVCFSDYFVNNRHCPLQITDAPSLID